MALSELAARLVDAYDRHLNDSVENAVLTAGGSQHPAVVGKHVHAHRNGGRTATGVHVHTHEHWGDSSHDHHRGRPGPGMLPVEDVPGQTAARLQAAIHASLNNLKEP